MALQTFTWSSATGGAWTTGSNWFGGTAPATSGTAAKQATADIGIPTSGPITLGSGVTVIGAINITANATLDISTGQTLEAGGAGAAAGDIAVINAGTVALAGGTLHYGTISVGGGTIVGFGTITEPGISGTLSTSGSGVVIASGGVLDILGASSNNILTAQGDYEIAGGATLQFDANSALSATSLPIINFQTAAGDLNVVAGAQTANVWGITGSVQTLNASLQDLEVGTTANSPSNASEITFGIGATNVISSTSIIGGSTLEVIVNSTTYVFDTNGSFSGDNVDWSNSGGVASIWVDTQPCYVEGTRVLTERGEVAVEELAEGDMVVTLAGETRSLAAVTWIGHRRMSLLQHPQPGLVAPIRVLKHAFGENLPSRDLLVSPDHCLFVDGKLIPAKLLINDMTIVQEHGATSVHYYHIELARHSVILAEGLPAESYLDTGNRAMFANAGLAMVLHPDFTVNESLKCWETDACAPLAVSRDLVQPVWQSLVEHAEALGYRRPDVATTTDPELRLVVDGRTLQPLSSDGDRYVFSLPAGASSMRLVSRASVPSDTAAYLGDWRRLGIAVRRIVVRDSRGLTELPPDHPGLTQGWHLAERNADTMWRWMDGDAVLPIEPTDGPALLEVHVAAAMRHVVRLAEANRLAA